MIAIVFLNKEFRFEVWLGGFNKTIQNTYWDLFRKNNWDKYHIPASIKGIDSIVEYTLVEEPDFRDLDTLTTQIERGTVKFITNIESFLSQN